MCDSCQVLVTENPNLTLRTRAELVFYLFDYGSTHGKASLIDLVTNLFCIGAQYTSAQLSTVELIDVCYHTAAHAFDLGQSSSGQSVPGVSV